MNDALFFWTWRELIETMVVDVPGAPAAALGPPARPQSGRLLPGDGAAARPHATLRQRRPAALPRRPRSVP